MDKKIEKSNESTTSSSPTAPPSDGLENLKYINLNFVENSDSSSLSRQLGDKQLNKQPPNKILPSHIGRLSEVAEEPPKSGMQEKSLADMGFKSKIIDGWENIVQPPKENLYTLLRNMINGHIKPNVQIRVGTVNFNCHMMVLQCYSDFFMDCNNEILITLPEEKITPQAFMMVYEWMLSDEPLVQREGILELFNAANFLKIKGLVNQCWLCLDDDIRFREDTAFLLYLEARNYGLESLEQLMLTRICKFFLTLVASKEFLDLKAKEICTLLSSNSIGVNSEVEIFMAVVRWLSHNWAAREDQMIEVMSCVRFSLMAPWFLVTLNKSTDCVEIERIVANSEIKKMINDGISFATTQLYYGENREEFLQFLERHQLVVPVQRQWIYDKDCSYHHNVECPNMQNMTYKSFLDYLEMIQIIGKDYWKTLEMTSENIKNPQCCVRSAEGRLKQNKKNLYAVHTKKSRDKGIQVETKDGNCAESEFNTTSICSLNSVLGSNNVTTHDVSDKQCPRTNNRPNLPVMGKSSSMVLVDLNKMNQEEKQKSPFKYLTGFRSIGNFDRVGVQTEVDGKMKQQKQQKQQQHQAIAFSTTSCIKDQTKINKAPVLSTMSDDTSSKEKSSLREFDQILHRKVLIFGGTDPYNVNQCRHHSNEQIMTGKDVLFYDLYESQWKHLTVMPNIRHHHCAVLCKGRVYIVGGTRPAPGSIEKVIYENAVWSFDPYTLKWRNETSLPQPRRDFALIAIENGDTECGIGEGGCGHQTKASGLFVIGGECKDGTALSTTFFYDIEKKVWIRKPSLNIGRYGLSAAVVNNEIWIAGGITGIGNPSDGTKRIPVITDLIECYNLKHDGLWIQSSVRLQIPRFFTKLCHIAPFGLYLIGGIAINNDNQFTSLNSVDRFDFQSNSWRSFIEMRNSRHGHGAATFGDRILIVGGVSTLEKKTLSTVECFCTKRLKWVNDFAYLPQPLSSAALIIID